MDDNRDLLHFLERLMADAGWKLLTAESAAEARKLVAAEKPNAALLDYMLPDGNGVTVEEIKAALLHATAYCGIPAGLDAFKAAHEVLVQEGVLTGKAS